MKIMPSDQITTLCSVCNKKINAKTSYENINQDYYCFECYRYKKVSNEPHRRGLMRNYESCPICNEELEAEFVDIGIGFEQVTESHCPNGCVEDGKEGRHNKRT